MAALGTMSVNNPSGILIERDELISLLMYLDREEHAVARTNPRLQWAAPAPS